MKKCLSAGAALAVALVLAACGGGSSDNGSTSAGSSKPISELRFAQPPVPRMDYVTSRNVPAFTIGVQVAPGLVTLDRTGRVVPMLARSFDSPDPKTYIYTLDPTKKFSDGKPVTVEDVVWSLERNRAKDAQTQSDWLNVASITAQGDDKVVIKLKTPDVSFANGPMIAQVIEKAAAVRGGVDKIGTPSNLPIGAGPYKFVSFTPNVDVRLVRNEHWAGPRPAAERVTFKLLRDASAIALALRSGDIDGTGGDSRRGLEAPGIRVYEAPGAGLGAVSMNTIVAPFDDVHVRRAIAYALDREGIVQATSDGQGTVEETLTPVESLYGSIAPVADVKAAFATLPRYDFDLAAARAELAKSRYPDGFSTTLPVMAGTPDATGGQAIAQDLAKIGIKVKVQEMPVNEWLAVLYGPRDRIGMMTTGYGSGTPDPNQLMSFWLDPAQARVNGLNAANYRNPEVARLLVEQRQEQDGAKRLALITRIFRIMKEDVPYAPMSSGKSFMGLSDKYVYPTYSTWSFVTPWVADIRAAG